MNQAFDAYYKWLGIPPEEQPPSHYRLLAIRQFENDPDVIEAAADQRMAHLRTFQAGKYSSLSQKLLNEVASAKVCLLHPEKKAQYDGMLRAQSSDVLSRMPPSPPPVAVTPPPAPAPLPPRAAPPLPPPPAIGPSAPPSQGFDLEQLGVSNDFGRGSSGMNGGAGRPEWSSSSTTAAQPATGRSAASRHRDSRKKKQPIGLWVGLGGAAFALLVLVAVLSFTAPGDTKSNGAGNSAKPSANNRSATGSDQPKSPDLVPGAPGAEDRAALAAAFPPDRMRLPTSPIVGSRLADRLVLHMNFNPDSIQTRNGRLLVLDLSGSGNHGVGQDVRLVADNHGGRLRGAIEPGGGLLKTLGGLINRQSQYTVAAWVYLPSTVAETWWFNEQGAGPVFGIGSGSRLAVRSHKSRQGNPDYVPFNNPRVLPGQWNFIAVRRLAGGSSLDRLGVTVNEQHVTMNARFAVAEVDGGSYVALGGGKGVRLGEVIVFHRALSEEEIMALYARRSTSDPPVLGATPPPVVRPKVVVPPAVPQLIHPAPSGSQPNCGPGPNPSASWPFNWTPVRDAEAYHLMVTAPGQESPTVSIDTIPDIETLYRYTLRQQIADGQRQGWRWKVRAKVGDAWTPWSQERTFNVVSADASGNPGAAGRSPVPSQGEQDAMMAQVRPTYQRQLQEAKGRADLAKLVSMLRSMAADASGEPVRRYVLLDKARTITAGYGDASGALQVADEMVRAFDLDALELRTATVKEAMRHSTGASQCESTAAAALRVLVELEAASRYEAAMELTTAVRDRARTAGSGAVALKFAGLANELKQRQEADAAIEPVRKTLITSPLDPVATTTMGLFLCGMKDDWGQGLPMLGRCGDAKLRELAQLDASSPEVPEIQLRVAEGWFELAGQRPPFYRNGFYRRAVGWYQRCRASLPESDKRKVDQRLQTIRTFFDSQR